MIPKIIYPLIFSFLSFNFLCAQNSDLAEIPFTLEDGPLLNDFAGGFNAPQLAKIDLNLDGLEDLVIYDRKGDIAKTFIYTIVGDSFEYMHDPEFQKNLPPILNWVRIEDYNQDGIKDIFTSPRDFASSSIQVFKGKIENDELSFDLVEFNYGDLDILYFPFNDSWINIYVSPVDVPSMRDVDNDGDLDVLAFDPGGSYVYLYANQAVEKNLSLDTLDFELVDMCFGKFKESGLSETIILADDNSDCAVGLTEPSIIENRHAGSTVESFDVDGDGDYELLLGDLTSSKLMYLHNGGTPAEAFMTDTILGYPDYSTSPEFSIFLAAYYIDIDNDNVRDLVVCPNASNGSTNIHNFWFYLNIGQDDQPEFQFVQDDFLNDTNIDLGSETNPAFCDYNQDGLIDLLIGSSGEFNPAGADAMSLWLFENIGTADMPAYELVDSDYLNFSINRSDTSNPAPAFGDLDGDGDEDMVISDNQGYIYYFENTAGPGNPFDFAQPIYQFMDIKPGQNTKMEILDINQDGLGDFIIGERNLNAWNERIGNVNYFENIGSVNNPVFEPDVTILPNNPTFGDINTKTTGFATGSSSPKGFITEDGFTLVTGSESGLISVYESSFEGSNAPFNEVTNNLSQIKEGRLTTCDIADIDNDGFLEIAVGNSRGGLSIYNTILQPNGVLSNTQATLPESKIVLHPNPANDYIFVAGINEFTDYRIYDANGRIHKTGKIPTLNQLDISTLSSGIYFISFMNTVDNEVVKFIKAKSN